MAGRRVGDGREGHTGVGVKHVQDLFIHTVIWEGGCNPADQPGLARAANKAPSLLAKQSPPSLGVLSGLPVCSSFRSFFTTFSGRLWDTQRLHTRWKRQHLDERQAG